MATSDSVASWLIKQAEERRLPDSAIRAGMRRVIGSRLRSERSVPSTDRDMFWEEAWTGPIAVSVDDANEQHYEVPAEFFDLVLGPRRKYSAGFWEGPGRSLGQAELAMFELYVERAELVDGQAILDLGCGWGAFTLWAAERFPNSSVLAVSNSSSQGSYIREAAVERGLTNVEVSTSDVNEFAPAREFDRVVSIEMLEHVRNHRELFGRIRDWLSADGKVFVHVFANNEVAYTFETEGPGSWMAQTFFTGGVMPSADLLPSAAIPYLEHEGTWWVDGTHYSKTLEAWLGNLDARRADVVEVLRDVHGSDAELWMQRWRMFFMACSEMFSMFDGGEWGVVHHRFSVG